MEKINAEHLARKAVIYVRQSTPGQVIHHKESQKLQYRLADRARELGWENIEVVDGDLGRSAAGTITRPGFQQLVNDVCANKVGAILSLDSSRLARNGREWHTLLELCAVVNTLLIDPESVYNTQLSNDRLLLGLKGELSEMELRTLRERSQAAIKEKARRGELYLMVAAGYIKTKDNKLRKTPDLRLQRALMLVFEKFREYGSIRQVYKWFVENSLELPVAKYDNAEKTIVWKFPRCTTVARILQNPLYGGAYAYGRTKNILQIKDGCKTIKKGVLQKREDWYCLLKEHHEGYISWEEFEQNQHIIAQNTNMKRPIVVGSAGSGDALLVGVLRCGHCGLKLAVKYQGSPKKFSHYKCRGREKTDVKKGCIAFGGKSADQAIADIILEIISPHGLNASLKAIEKLSQGNIQVVQQRKLALEQARYEAQRAKRQFEAVEPENRLVAAELERDWNQALEKVVRLDTEILNLEEASSLVLCQQDKEKIMALGHDLPYVWYHPQSSAVIQKKIVRLLIKEIVAFIEDQKIKLIIHWYGGNHSTTEFQKKKQGETRFVTKVETKQIIADLARIMPDKHIVTFLNRLGKRTATGLTWTPQRVCSLRKDYKIPVYQAGERLQRGELTVEEVSVQLAISKSKVKRLIDSKILPARQTCPATPWIINKSDLELEQVNRAATTTLRKYPRPQNLKQLTFTFQ